jgi:hypothetical protein
VRRHQTRLCPPTSRSRRPIQALLERPAPIATTAKCRRPAKEIHRPRRNESTGAIKPLLRNNLPLRLPKSQKRRVPRLPRNCLPPGLPRWQKRRVLRRLLLRTLAIRLCGQARGDAPQHSRRQIHSPRRTRMLPQQRRLGRKRLSRNASLFRGGDVVPANHVCVQWRSRKTRRDAKL